MLSRRDVVAIAERHGLASLATRLSEIVEPGWQLCRDNAVDTAKPGACKLGGGADLAADEQWPTNDRGIALTFLAQVDCQTLPSWVSGWDESTAWPHGGRLLRFFADLVDDPIGPSRACVLSCPPDTALRRTAPPPLPTPWPAGGPFDEAESEQRHTRLAEAGVTAVPFVGVPSYVPVDLGRQLSDPDLERRYLRWEAETMYDGDGTICDPAHWLLGPAVSTNVDDVRDMVAWRYRQGAGGSDETAATPQGTPDWVCLLHLSDDELLGIDPNAGALTILVPREDLAHGDYHRAFCAVQT